MLKKHLIYFENYGFKRKNKNKIFFSENRGWFKNSFEDFLIGNLGYLKKII